MAVKTLTYKVLPEFETSLSLSQAISPEHIEKTGFLQLRWWSWVRWSAEPNRQVFGATLWIGFGCLLQGDLNRSSQSLLLPANQGEGPDNMDDCSCADHSVRQRRSWLTGLLLTLHHSSGHYRWETPSHSLCLAYGVMVLQSGFSSHPASGCQCWDATEMVIMSTSEPFPAPLANCLFLRVEASCRSLHAEHVAAPQGWHCCPSALNSLMLGWCQDGSCLVGSVVLARVPTSFTGPIVMKRVF